MKIKVNNTLDFFITKNVKYCKKSFSETIAKLTEYLVVRLSDMVKIVTAYRKVNIIKGILFITLIASICLPINAIDLNLFSDSGVNINSIEKTLKDDDDRHFKNQVTGLKIPPRQPGAESGSVFMKRIAQLSPGEREEEIYKAISSGNIPEFLRCPKTIKGEFADTAGIMHVVVYEVIPDYLSVGNDTDYCRIPMNPHTAQRLANLFGASLITSKLSDEIYKVADIRLVPFTYIPVGNANELVKKFEEHNAQIEKQFKEAGGRKGQLVAGIKKDIILSVYLTDKPNKVVIYGWHKPDGKPIQPVYAGHVDWYVDYSHGIRFINNQVSIDGTQVLFTDILKDPLLYKIFSNEERPMKQTVYIKE